jgi:hypothetical protein
LCKKVTHWLQQLHWCGELITKGELLKSERSKAATLQVHSKVRDSAQAQVA